MYERKEEKGKIREKRKRPLNPFEIKTDEERKGNEHIVRRNRIFYFPFNKIFKKKIEILEE